MKTGIANNSKLRRLAGALGLLLALSLLVNLAPTLVIAIPQQPHQFYGNVTIGGAPAPEGTAVSARIGGIEYASTTVDAEGRYGYDPLFKVPADDPDTPEKEGGVPGETVEFYVGGTLAAQYEFEIWGVTELNLVIIVLAVTSNGCCSISVDGETVEPGSITTFLFTPGAEVTLTADDSDPCCRFDGWAVDGGEPTTENPITITMDSDHTAVATCSRRYILFLPLTMKNCAP